ncbi:MAG: sensor histidine kinase [Clostridia bacterium]|nr:sensor histidine kinase [Clostridia bacterium]
MKFLGKYLKYRRGEIVLFLVCAAVFAVWFSLNGLPLVTWVYPFALCALLCGGCLVRDAMKAFQTHRRLTGPREGAEAAELPFPATLAEEDCIALIRKKDAKLAEQHREAKRRTDAMRDYYTMWAHSIKTPLAAMRLNLGDADDPRSKRLRFDLDRTERYAEMALTYSRLESDSTDYVFRRVSADALVRTEIKRFSGEFIFKKLRLEYAVPETAEVLTDEKWLGFAVGQVLSNAVKYTPEGGTVSVGWEAPDTLVIRDTGVGIAKEDLPRVFENGFTGFNGRADRRATGIGLYLTKRILTELGHTIAVASVPGAGTEVRIGLAPYELKTE